ncbi:MAG TPA: hypothetical protein VFZ58_05620 [Candidatus Saccharimonadales bacterium]
MLLVSHIMLAFAGLGLGAYSYFKPSNTRLYSSYLCGAGAFLSGVMLLISQPSHLPSACITGLAYYALFAAIVLAAKRRLKLLNSAT